MDWRIEASLPVLLVAVEAFLCTLGAPEDHSALPFGGVSAGDCGGVRSASNRLLSRETR